MSKRLARDSSPESQIEPDVVYGTPGKVSRVHSAALSETCEGSQSAAEKCIHSSPPSKYVGLHPAFVPDTPESSKSSLSSQKSAVSTSDFMDRVLAVMDALRDLCYRRTREGRDELGYLESPPSGGSAFDYSQTSSCGDVLHSKLLDSFLRESLPNLEPTRDHLMTDPEFLLNCLEAAVASHNKKSDEEKEEIQRRILIVDKLIEKLDIVSGTVGRYSNQSDHVADECADIITRLTYLFYVWYCGIPKSGNSLPSNFDWMNRYYQNMLQYVVEKKIPELDTEKRDVLKKLVKLEENKHLLDMEKLCEAMHKFNLSASIYDLVVHIVGPTSEISVISALLNTKDLDNIPLNERIRHAYFSSNSVDLALASCSDDVKQAVIAQMDHRLLPGLVDWIKHRISSFSVQCHVIYHSVVRAKGTMTVRVISIMDFGALESDLESISILISCVEKIIQDARWTRDLCTCYIKQNIMMQSPIHPDIAETVKVLTSFDGRLAIHNAKLEQSVGLLSSIQRLLTEKIDEYRSVKPPGADPDGDSLECHETLQHPLDDIDVPFFYLDCHKEILDSFMGAPHAMDVLELLNNLSLSQTDEEKKEEPGQGATTSSPSDGQFEKEELPDDSPRAYQGGDEKHEKLPVLNRDCLLIRNSPTLLPGI